MRPRLMRRRWIAGLLLTVAAAFSAAAADEPAENEMTTFQLVFVLRADPEEVAQNEHRAERVRRAEQYRMSGLLRDGAALIAGDLVDGGEIDKVMVLDVGTTGEAERIFNESPGVQSGLYEARVYSWWAAKDILHRPQDPEDRIACWLGLFKRPANAPRFAPEELERLQKGHLANIASMAEAGDLVIAGPVENGEDLRGILIFRPSDRSRIESLVAKDPAVQAGRLELELYRWMVPRGSLPAS